jgi:Flp pilus assembly pilin Flp
MWRGSLRTAAAAGRIRRLFREDAAQDLVEYALLAVVVAIASLLAIGELRAALHDAYVSWDTATQEEWVMPGPSGP